jgi:hypothetical protein
MTQSRFRIIALFRAYGAYPSKYGVPPAGAGGYRNAAATRLIEPRSGDTRLTTGASRWFTEEEDEPRSGGSLHPSRLREEAYEQR